MAAVIVQVTTRWQSWAWPLTMATTHEIPESCICLRGQPVFWALWNFLELEKVMGLRYDDFFQQNWDFLIDQFILKVTFSFDFLVGRAERRKYLYSSYWVVIHSKKSCAYLPQGLSIGQWIHLSGWFYFEICKFRLVLRNHYLMLCVFVVCNQTIMGDSPLKYFLFFTALPGRTVSVFFCSSASLIISDFLLILSKLPKSMIFKRPTVLYGYDNSQDPRCYTLVYV